MGLVNNGSGRPLSCFNTIRNQFKTKNMSPIALTPEQNAAVAAGTPVAITGDQVTALNANPKTMLTDPQNAQITESGSPGVIITPEQAYVLNTPVEVAPPIVPAKNEITLSDGRKAIVADGKGKHARDATRMADGDQSKYMGCLMAQLITIDGNKIVPEDLDEMPLKDYMALNVIFADQNF